MEDDTELFDDPVVAPKPVKSPTRPDGHDSKPWPTRPDGNDSKQLPTQPDGNDSRPWPTRPDGNDSKPWSTRPDGSDSKPWPTRPDGKNSKQERTGHSAQTGFPLTEWKINFNQKIPREKGKPNTSASAREWRGFPERGVRSESLPHYDDSNDIAPIDFSPRVIFKRDESPDDLLWSPACSMLPSDTEDCSNADPDKTRDEDKPFQDITKDRLHKDISGSYWRTPGKQAMALMAFRHAEVDLPDIDASDSPASGVEQHEDRLSPDSFFDEPNQDHHKQSFRQHDSDSKLLSLDPLRDDQQQFHTMYELPNHPQPCEILYNDSTPATVTTPSDDPLQSSVTSGIEAQGVDPDAEIAEDEDSGDLRAFEQPGAGYFDTGQPSNPRAQADESSSRYLRDHDDLDGSRNPLMMTDLQKERRQHGGDHPADRHLRDHSDQDGFMDRLVMTDVEKERRHHGRGLPAGRHLRDHSDQDGSRDRLVMTDVEKERRHHGRDLPAGRHLRDHSDQGGSRDRLVMTDLEKEGGIQGCPEEADRESDDPTAYKHETLAGHDDTLTASRMGLFLQRRSRKRKRVSGVRMVAVLLKYCLFVLNFIFWVASVGAIVTGAWVLSERGQLVREPTAFFLDPSAMTCLVGAITFVVAFIGCLGALRENICLLKTSQLSMLGVLVLEALIGATVFAFYAMPEVRRHIKAGPEEVLKMAIRRYHDDEELQRWVDLIQREFKCCGASHSDTGYMDWTENAYFNCTSANPSAQRCAVPRSCCIIERGEYINYMCGFDSTNKNPSELFDRIYTQGCMKGLGKWLSSHDVAIGSASIAIIIPQIICVIFARLLIQHIQRQRVRWRVLHSSK